MLAPNSLLLHVTANKGNGAYLLKPGSKRRRKQVDIAGQNAQQEMEDLQAADHLQRIA